MPREKIVAALRKYAVSMDSIAPDPANARLHPAANLDAIRGSLLAFGQQRPVVVDSKGVIVAGNGLYQAARLLGWTKIAAVKTALKGVDRVGYALADNRTAELAEWDEEALLDQLQALEGEVDLAAIGFDEDELARLLNPDMKGGLADPDAVPEPPDEATTQPGDLWILGDHRLLCRDAGSSEDVDRLLGGEAVHLVNTDPPYNVNVEPRSATAIAAGVTSISRREDLQCEHSTTEGGKQDRERKRKRKEAQAQMHHQGFDVARDVSDPAKARKKMRAKDRPLENDFLSAEDFERLLLAWFGQMARVLVPGGAFYIWGGYANLGNYPPALKASGLYFSQGIVWDKKHPVLTRKDFMGAFEMCFYGWREGAGHHFYGPNNATDLWHMKKVSPQKMTHLTEKPVELAVRAIQYSSKPGEHILDLFGGSGSTLIGCEQMGRRAYLMEMDPLYCDVIVQRWEEFTGKRAERPTSSTKKKGNRAKRSRKKSSSRPKRGRNQPKNTPADAGVQGDA